MTTGADVLRKGAAIFDERNNVYKDNYVRLGNVMAGLFPTGLTITTPDQWTRLYMFMTANVKLSRYATNFENGGHADSSVDASVYAAMLHAFDEDLKK